MEVETEVNEDRGRKEMGNKFISLHHQAHPNPISWKWRGKVRNFHILISIVSDLICAGGELEWEFILADPGCGVLEKMGWLVRFWRNSRLVTSFHVERGRIRLWSKKWGAEDGKCGIVDQRTLKIGWDPAWAQFEPLPGVSGQRDETLRRND